MLLLSTVEDVFELTDRSSVVVAPGLPRRGALERRIKAGDPVVLETPDGSMIHTVIGGLEMLSPPHPDSIPLLLGPGLTKQMVPIGTKLWVSEVSAD